MDWEVAEKVKSALAGVAKFTGAAAVVAVAAAVVAVAAPKAKLGLGRLEVVVVLVVLRLAAGVVVVGAAPKVKAADFSASLGLAASLGAGSASRVRAGPAVAGLELSLAAGAGRVTVELTLTDSFAPPNSAGSLKVTDVSGFFGDKTASTEGRVAAAAVVEGVAVEVPKAKGNPPAEEDWVVAAGAASPRVKGNPPALVEEVELEVAEVAEVAAVAVEGTLAASSAFLVAASWSGKMLSILLSRLFWSSLSSRSSFSPMTCLLGIFLAGVPSTSAGLGGTMPVTPALAGLPSLASAGEPEAALLHRLASSTDSFRFFFHFSSLVLSGERNTLVFFLDCSFSSSSSSLCSSSLTSSLALLSMLLLELRLASSSAATALLRSGPWLWALAADGCLGGPEVWDWACAVTTDWVRLWERWDMEERGREGWGGWCECPNRLWFLERSEPRERSASLDTRWLVVCPTTPLEKSGGISMEREEPREEEESLLALLLPSPTDSSLGRRALFPLSSASTAITCLGSVLPPSPSPRPLAPPPPRSVEPPYRLKGLNGSEGAMRRVTGARPRIRPNFEEFLEVRRGGESLERCTRGSWPALAARFILCCSMYTLLLWFNLCAADLLYCGDSSSLLLTRRVSLEANPGDCTWVPGAKVTIEFRWLPW